MLTIGHSTLPLDRFLCLLADHEIALLVDIRTIPRSRHNPQFNGDSLPGVLAPRGIGYRHMKTLGGLRKALKNSVNTGFRNMAFRGYADYMETEEFSKALQELIDLGREQRVALMCAEAVPWRCHRSLVADALLVRGIGVRHILAGDLLVHRLTSFARVEGTRIVYASPADLSGRLPRQ